MMLAPNAELWNKGGTGGRANASPAPDLSRLGERPLATTKIPYRAVYAIVCSDGRAYVGGTETLSRRWGKHLSQLRLGRHHSKRLQEAWDALGSAAFAFTVLEDVPPEASLFEAEQRHINRLDSFSNGFNVCPEAGSHAGLVYSEASRARMRTAQAGKHTGARNARAKVSEADVVEIRRLAASGVIQREIGEAYGLTRAAVSEIVKRRNWKHVA